MKSHKNQAIQSLLSTLASAGMLVALVATNWHAPASAAEQASYSPLPVLSVQ